MIFIDQAKKERQLESMLAEQLRQCIGVTIKELVDAAREGIESKLLPPVDPSKSFKVAKREFLKHYLDLCLLERYGNVSKLAEELEVDRKHISKLLKTVGIDAKSYRKNLPLPTLWRRQAVEETLREVFGRYESVLSQEKLTALGKKLPELAEQITAVLQPPRMNFKEAKQLFEFEYVVRLLELHDWDIMAAARAAGMSERNLYRKLAKAKQQATPKLYNLPPNCLDSMMILQKYQSYARFKKEAAQTQSKSN